MSPQHDNPDKRILIYPRVGDLIVARPRLGDVTFSRAVCMMLDVDTDNKNTGCMGLMLNKQLDDVSLADIFTEIPNAEKIPLFLGGPVECERLFVLHTFGDKFGPAIEILPGLYVGGDIDMISDYIAAGGETEGRLRFFIGYSGWDKEQLIDELTAGYWEVTRLDTVGTALEGSGDEYWQKIVGHMGADYRHWLIVPEIPELN